MIILWIIVGILFVGSGSVYVFLKYQMNKDLHLPPIDERELDQYRLLLNDNLTGAVNQWNDDTWDKYNELNDKYGSIVHTHIKGRLINQYLEIKSMPKPNNWTGSRASISLNPEYEQMRRPYISPPSKPRKEIYITGYINQESKRIHIEYGAPFPGIRAVAIFTIEDYQYITNEKFKEKFGGDKPTFSQLPPLWNRNNEN